MGREGLPKARRRFTINDRTGGCSPERVLYAARRAVSSCKKNMRCDVDIVVECDSFLCIVKKLGRNGSIIVDVMDKVGWGS